MGIRKYIFKIIAVALVVPILGAGAVPAIASCEGVCSCCKTSQNQPAVLAIDPSLIHRIHDFDHISKIFHQPQRIASVQEKAQTASGCHQGNAPVPCDMEPLPAPDPLKGLIQSISHAERSPLVASAFASSDRIFNPHPFFGLTNRHLMPVRAAPIQLFIQKSSFLY